MDVTAEDLANLGTLLKAFNDNDGELPDEVAEQVAGVAFDISNLGKILGAIGDFMKALESPITTLISIFSGESNGGGFAVRNIFSCSCSKHNQSRRRKSWHNYGRRQRYKYHAGQNRQRRKYRYQPICQISTGQRKYRQSSA